MDVDQLSSHILRVDSPVSPMIGSALVFFPGDLHVNGDGAIFLKCRGMYRGLGAGSLVLP